MDRIYEHPSLSESFKEYCRVKGAIYLCDLKRINPFNLLHYGFSLEEIYNISSVVAKTFDIAREVKVNRNGEVVTAPEKEFEVSVNGCTKQYTFKNWSQIPEQYYALEIDNFKYLFTRTQNQMLRVNKLTTLKSLTRNEDKVKMAIRCLKKSDIKALCSYLSRLEEIKYYLSDAQVLELFLESEAYKEKELVIDVNNDNQILIFMEAFGNFQLKTLLESIIKNTNKIINNTSNDIIHLAGDKKQEKSIVNEKRTVTQGNIFKHENIGGCSAKYEKSALSVSIGACKTKYSFKQLCDIPSEYYDIRLEHFRFLFTRVQTLVFKSENIKTIGDLASQNPRIKKSLRNFSKGDLNSISVYLNRLEEVRYYLSDTKVKTSFLESALLENEKFSLNLSDNNSLIILMEAVGSLRLIKYIEELIGELRGSIFQSVITLKAQENNVDTCLKIIDSTESNKKLILECVEAMPQTLDIGFEDLCCLFDASNEKVKAAKINGLSKINALCILPDEQVQKVFKWWKLDEIKQLVEYCMIIDYLMNGDVKLYVLTMLISKLESVGIMRISELENTSKVISLLKVMTKEELNLVLESVNFQ